MRRLSSRPVSPHLAWPSNRSAESLETGLSVGFVHYTASLLYFTFKSTVVLWIRLPLLPSIVSV